MSSPPQLAIDDLRVFKLFSGFDVRELEAIAAILAPVEAKAGKFIIKESSDGSDMYFIAAGKVKVCRADKDGKEVTLALCGPGDVIGEIALLTDSIRTADVVSLTPSVLWRCSRADFEAHCRRFSGLSYALLKYMAARVRQASIRISDLALYDVTCRVARALYGMSVIATRDDVEVHMISDRPTHQTLASLVGASREAVTRALKVLEEEGHLEMDEERMWLHSLPAH